MTAPQPTRYGTLWHLPDRRPTIARALRLLELPSKPRSRKALRDLLAAALQLADVVEVTP